VWIPGRPWKIGSQFCRHGLANQLSTRLQKTRHATGVNAGIQTRIAGNPESGREISRDKHIFHAKRNTGQKAIGRWLADFCRSNHRGPCPDQGVAPADTIQGLAGNIASTFSSRRDGGNSGTDCPHS
jgi:hypothetical protein